MTFFVKMIKKKSGSGRQLLYWTKTLKCAVYNFDS